MKFVSWNCCGAFRNKLHLLEAFAADVLIIQECEEPSAKHEDYKAWATNFLWTGDPKKGLGIFAKPHIHLEKLQWPHQDLQLFLPCSIANKLNLLATWTKKGKGYGASYVGQLLTYLNLNAANLASKPTIVCGDFNSNAIWDKQNRGQNHSEVVRYLSDLNITSLYHMQTQEQTGCETRPTFYLQRNISKPYHLDYAFVSENLLSAETSFEIGRAELWLEYSDHMPLVFTTGAGRSAVLADH